MAALTPTPSLTLKDRPFLALEVSVWTAAADSPRAGTANKLWLVSLGAPAHVPSRPSAVEREQVIRALRMSREAERLSLDTFSARVELALSAKTDAQLADLLVDLPSGHPLGRLILAAVARLSGWTACVALAWREARTPPLALPARGSLTLGRSRECDWIVGDTTVSRRHALLRHGEGKWWLSDLGSTNGTFVNGWKVLSDVEVRPGDHVTFGQVDYRLTHCP
jgi:FHA domain-containing protein/uncharacterized protein DUF1707